MPITLEKLFSPTATVSFEFLGDTVNVVWAPFRYTGEMQELAEKVVAEQEVDQAALTDLRAEAKQLLDSAAAIEEEDGDEAQIAALREEGADKLGEAQKAEIRLSHRDKRSIREVLATLLVSWDVLDARGKPVPTTLEELRRLPDPFVQAVFLSLSSESRPDPQKAPNSDEPSRTGRTSARSQIGTSTSSPRMPSGSARSSSTNARHGRGHTRSGGRGR
jgi:hypothetical protein